MSYVFWIATGIQVLYLIWVAVKGLEVTWHIELYRRLQAVCRAQLGGLPFAAARIRGEWDSMSRSGSMTLHIKAMLVLRGRIHAEMSHLAYRGEGSICLLGMEAIQVRITMGTRYVPLVAFRWREGSWIEVVPDGEKKPPSRLGKRIRKFVLRLFALDKLLVELELCNGDAAALLAIATAVLQGGLAAAGMELHRRFPRARLSLAARPVFEKGKNRCLSQGIISAKISHLMARTYERRTSA